MSEAPLYTVHTPLEMFPVEPSFYDAQRDTAVERIWHICKRVKTR